MKVQVWNKSQAKEKVSKHYTNSQTARKPFEFSWQRAEAILYSTSGSVNAVVESQGAEGKDEVDSGTTRNTNSALVFKNVRFLHAQMSANPPSVMFKPTSSDQEDRRRADAADRVARWALRQYKLQEVFDQSNLNTLSYGNGLIKTTWDPHRGAILEYNKESGEIVLEGDIHVYVPFLWNIFLDPDARSWDEVKWIIEEIYMDFEEAVGRWPEHEQLLKTCLVSEDEGDNSSSNLSANRFNCVKLLEYWETGLPVNGYMGRYGICSKDGTPLEEFGPNPFRFKQAGSVRAIEMDENLTDEQKELAIEKLPERARLPYHLTTDVDIPNTVWGKSPVDYASELQNVMNRVDSAFIDNVEAHGVARMVVPKGSEVTSVNDLSNSPWDVVEVESNQPPFFMEVPQLMPEMTQVSTKMETGINNVMGVNDAMFGVQERETSGTSMQYATNNGNLIRRRLFNKYVLTVESVYRAILDLVRKHWSIERTINVLGKENAMEAVDLKGSDIDGGFDVVAEYGASLSLDPIARQEQILTLVPLYKEAGLPIRNLVEKLRLSDLDGLQDELKLAGTRQKEIFDQMIADNLLVQPKPLMDHQNMVAWAMNYFMTAEFNYLTETQQEICKEHIRLRIALAAQEQATGGGQPGTAPGMPTTSGPQAAPQVPATSGQETPPPMVG